MTYCPPDIIGCIQNDFPFIGESALTKGSDTVSVPAVPDSLSVHLVVRVVTAEAVSFWQMFLVRSWVSVSEMTQGRVTLTMARLLPQKHTQVLPIRAGVE